MTGPKPHTAMILAAGLGTRIRDVSGELPKPLLPVAGVALIDYALGLTVDAGIRRVVVNTHYRAEAIRAHVANWAVTDSRPTLETTYEPERLETGGGVRNALTHLGQDPFFVLNSDSIVSTTSGISPLTRLASAWDDATMDILLLLCPLERASGYEGRGDFVYPAGAPGEQAAMPLQRLAGTKEQRGPVFTGVQLLHPRLFDNAPDGAYSLNRHYDEAIATGRLFGVVHDGDWFHVGTPDGLRAAEAALSRQHMP